MRSLFLVVPPLVLALVLESCGAVPARPSVPVAAPVAASPPLASAEATDPRVQQLAEQQLADSLERLADEHAGQPEIAAPALLRLASLAHDEGDAVRSRAVLERLVREHPDHPATSQGRLQLAYVAYDAVEPETARARLLSLLCPRSPLDAEPPAVVPSVDACVPRAAAATTLAHAWFLLGEIDFEAGLPGTLDRAVLAYGRAAIDPALASFAIYKRAWSLYRRDRYAEAMSGFERLLGDAREALRADALQYAAICAAEPDWDTDGHEDAVLGLARPEVRALVDGSVHASALLRAMTEVLLDELRCEAAREATRALASRDPDAAAALEPRFTRCVSAGR